MRKRNPYDGRCNVCGSRVRALEGLVEATDRWPFYRILCLEDAPAGALDPPPPPEASKLPSIHLDDQRFER
jgi:predicted DCC family thiol-disulfide oxidoreductase YuxK